MPQLSPLPWVMYTIMSFFPLLMVLFVDSIKGLSLYSLEQKTWLEHNFKW